MRYVVYCSDHCRYTAGNRRKAERKPPPAEKPAPKIDLSNPRLAAALKHIKQKARQRWPVIFSRGIAPRLGQARPLHAPFKGKISIS